MTVRIRQYTVEDAFERVQLEPPASASQSRQWSDYKAGASWDDAVRMAQEGDPDSARGLKKYLGVLTRVRQATRSVSRWGQAGSAVDVGRFLSGDPECMVETVRARRASPVLKIAVERCVPYHITTEEMRASGASALAVVEALRTAGVPAEIWVTFSISTWGGDGHENLSEQVLVQESGHAIDIDRLAYWVANPSAFRRLAFALYEQEPEDVRKLFHISNTGGYGSANSTPPNADEFDEIAPSFSGDVTRWVKEVLERRSGITVLDEDMNGKE